MKLEVEFICQDLIKPSSPTPHHLHHLRLSFLDGLQPPICMPIVLFYSKESNSENSVRCNELKKSLSKTLTMFYPLAGRVNNNTFIDCNDEGAFFVQAQANCQLSDILQNYNPSDSNKLIPLQPHQCKNYATFFQVTFFNCGGLCVSFSLSHKLGDALSQFQFLNSWAVVARGDSVISTPLFGTATLFPPIKLQSGFDAGVLVEKDNKIVTKRFIFKNSIIEALRAKYADEIGYSPSRIVALAGFIWSRFRAAVQRKEADGNIYSLHNLVNLRPKMERPLSNLSFGNLVTSASVQANMNAKHDGDARIVSEMSNAIRSVNTEYVKYLQKTNVIINLMKEEVKKLVKGDVIGFYFTSLCKIPIYEVDFGWGKPVFVGSAQLPFKNQVSFLDTRKGGGVEAWVNLKEEDMAKFEIDKDLLEHVDDRPFMIETLKLDLNSRL
ncbi:stemmadenine O-acetyltransferase-like [Mercurialis annua]|uniref:stemmadenine O-acetyltransferase-like n=1 Tax=Mercurialis annua TaxID=3986 RepID=UPI00215E651E|nr:stemmadenine O-acetyltransferase-like [Mercurialis annua]